jgi:hypothetical protein
MRKALADITFAKDIDRYMAKDHWLSDLDQMSELMPRRRVDMATLSRAVLTGSSSGEEDIRYGCINHAVVAVSEGSVELMGS